MQITAASVRYIVLKVRYIRRHLLPLVAMEQANCMLSLPRKTLTMLLIMPKASNRPLAANTQLSTLSTYQQYLNTTCVTPSALTTLICHYSKKASPLTKPVTPLQKMILTCRSSKTQSAPWIIYQNTAPPKLLHISRVQEYVTTVLPSTPTTVKTKTPTKKIRQNSGSFVLDKEYLLNDDLRAWAGLAAEALDAYFAEADNASFGSVNREIAANKGAVACELGLANLTNNNLAGIYFLATKTLHTQALAGGIVDVFTGTACFYV
jgi:hypothetical protein